MEPQMNTDKHGSEKNTEDEQRREFGESRMRASLMSPAPWRPGYTSEMAP